MNRSRHAILVPLFAVLALLCCLTGTASAAFNHAATEPHYGNFLLRESEVSGFSAYEIADPTRKNGEWIYDSASGVPAYVRQNPWTAFDPEGLFMQIIGNWLGERWQAPQVVRSMSNHTGTVVGVTQGTLGVVSMVPALGKVADGLSAGISAAEGNYGEAARTAGGGSAGKLLAKAKGLMNVADTGADLSKIIKEGGEQIQKNGDAVVTTARETVEKTTKEVADAAPAAKTTVPHKNSLDYKGDTHVYAVRNPDGTVNKIGESAQGVRTGDGASKRAEQQVRKLNRETGPGHTSEIRKEFSTKKDAREYETNLIERFRRRFGEDKLEGNKTNR